MFWHQSVKLALVGSVVALAVIGLACGKAQPAASPTNTPTTTAQDKAAMEAKAMAEKKAMEEKTAMEKKLPNQQFAAHFVDSYPNHGATFALVPSQVQIGFDFPLHDSSSITLTKSGAPVETGPLTLGPRNLAMWVTPLPTAGDGLYLVKYKACWPDRSCHDGQLAFTVDSKTKASYLDMTGKKEVQIEMKDIKFQSAAIIISKGTKVTWPNRDSVTHFVNTDPHPSHNVLRELNSLDLNQGQSYSFTFTSPGEWGYHCSLHFPQGMLGRVIVEP